MLSINRTAIFTLCLICQLFFMSSCKNKEAVTDEAGLINYVPENAALVTCINSGSLRNKIDWDLINSSPTINLLKLGMKDNILLKFFNDADETGLNFDSEMYAYMLADTINNDPSAQLIIEIKDVSKFEKMIQEFSKNTLSKSSDFTHCAGKGFIAGWKNEILIMVFSATGMDADGAHLLPKLEQAFNIQTTILQSHPLLKNQFANTNDLEVWTNSSTANRLLEKRIVTEKKFEGELFYQLNFNKGAVDMNLILSPAEQEIKSALQEITNRSPQFDFIKMLPDSVFSIVQLSIEPSKFYASLDKLTEGGKEEFKQTIDSTLTEEEMQTLLKQFTGDAMISASKKDDNGFVAILQTTNEKSLETCKSILKNQQFENAGEFLMRINQSDTTYLKQSDNHLFISQSKELIEQCTNSNYKGKIIDAEINSLLKQNPVTGYFDISSLMNNSENNMAGMLSMGLQLFESALFSVEPMNNESIPLNLKLNLTDDSDYSINILLKKITELTGNLFK